MAIPVAYYFELIDPWTSIVSFSITIVNLISMLTYLNHDDELSVDSNLVYELVVKRKEDNEFSVSDLKLEIGSLSDPGHQAGDDSSSVDHELAPNIGVGVMNES